MLAEGETAMLTECIASGWVSSAGPFVTRFEESIAAFTGATHAVAVVNGTAALHLSLHTLGVKANDEVLLSPLTFVATANAITQTGAIPHFVDAEETSLGLSAAALRSRLREVTSTHDGVCINRLTGRRIAAIVAVHALGHPLAIPEVLTTATEFGLPVIEDAAESLGSWHGSRHTGCWGRCGVISFNGNKIITTGGGGAVLCDERALAERLRHLSTTAKLQHPWRYDHNEIAFNYRMPNLNAALGLAQMKRLPDLLRRKRALATRYATAFADSPSFQFIPEPPGTTSNYWLSSIRLRQPNASLLDELLEAAHAAGYLVRPLWTLLPALPMYSSAPAGELRVARRLAQSVINLPSSPGLATT